jgi:phosphotransferase system enzyme I (PtsP)
VDRTNPRVAKRYDNLNPASLTLIRLIVHSAAENSGELSLCGEMAGRPLDAMALLGLGCGTLSMAAGPDRPHQDDDPSACIWARLPAFVDRLCNRTDHSMRTRLFAFAAERGIVLK